MLLHHLEKNKMEAWCAVHTTGRDICYSVPRAAREDLSRKVLLNSDDFFVLDSQPTIKYT